MGQGAGEPSDRGLDQLGVNLGKLAVDSGFITPAQLREALVEQSTSRRGGAPRMLGEILLDRRLLSLEQLQSLLEEQERRETAAQAPKTVHRLSRKPDTSTFGKYVILREVGRGGMGVVYEAMDSQLNRKAALKMLLGGPSVDPKEEERFLREAQVSANLPRHPNIVGIYEAGALEGRRYIAMEFIEGLRMSDWRKSKSPGLKQQVTLLRDVALAMDHAHRQGVIHRDLKPANILVDARHQPHITDFGLAKAIRQDASLSLTASGAIMGTPSYMSPEQARGKKSVDRRTDLYAMGVMLYEILAGRLPFRGETPIEILMKAAHDPVQPPSAILRAGAHPPVDETLERICLKALSKEPRQRHPTAKALADDLTRWLKGEKVRIEKPRKNRTGLAVAIGAGAAALLLAFLGLAMSIRPAESAARPLAAEERRIAEAIDARKRDVEGAQTAAALEEAKRQLKALEEEKRRLQEQLRKPPAVAPPPPPPPPSPPAPAPVALPPDGPPAGDRAELVLGPGGRSAGLSLARCPPGCFEPATVDGKPCVRLARNGQSPNRRLYLDVHDGWIRPGDRVEVEMELWRGGGRSFRLDYDSTDAAAPEAGAYKPTTPVDLNGGRQWRTVRLLLPDPRFANRATGGNDVRLETQGDVDLPIHRVTFRRISDSPLRAAAVAEGSLRPGLAAEYYSGTGFDRLGLKRVDASIDFDWKKGPLWTGGPSDNASARWSGYLKVPRKGTYTFTLRSDDGVSLALNGVPVVLNWSDHPAVTDRGSCDLEEGFHRIVVEYFEGIGDAVLKLEVAGPGGALGPEAYFHPPGGAAPATVAVRATDEWTDTGVDLKEGQGIQVSCAGGWSQDNRIRALVGAAGSPSPAPPEFASRFPVPGANCMALVARVGPNGAPWVVRENAPNRVPGSGRLYLGPNDFGVQNNQGSLTVTLRVLDSTAGAPAGNGWVSVFNGRDLAGWQRAGGDPKVEGGAILLENQADLRLPVSGADFELRGSLQLLEGGTHLISGSVAFRRLPDREGEPFLVFHLDGDAHLFEADRIVGKSGAGKVSKWKWQSFVLRATGRTFTLEIEGKPVLTQTLSRTQGNDLILRAPLGGKYALKDLSLRLP
jgi:predicted Ser/Thr protein kinase